MANKNNQQNVQYVAISPDMLQASNQNDEIDLKELFGAIWQGKWLIILITSLFAVASVFYALSLPNIYKSEVLLAPADSSQQGGLGSLGQLGGLASLAGVSLGGGQTDKTSLALEILKSREFFANFVTKYQILPDLMAIERFEPSTTKVVYNKELYLESENKWVRDVKPPKKPEPSLQSAKKIFQSSLSITRDSETGMIKLSVDHQSPYVARDWVEWLVKEINFVMKNRDRQEAETSISYLQTKITQTNVVEQKTLLFQLIEEQAKTLMFAEVRDEYVFKTIDPALVPEVKFKPKRPLIVMLGTFVGGLVSIVALVLVHLIRSK
jgi:uncharacterized protein involved in exopolysaccharide biosynthesis